MGNLRDEVCVACRVDAPRLTERELAELTVEIPEWGVVEKNGVLQLTRAYGFDNFVSALDFTNLVGELAEQAGHHPAVLLEWGKVTVFWWTHKINGLHRNDVIMAAKTDALFPNL